MKWITLILLAIAIATQTTEAHAAIIGYATYYTIKSARREGTSGITTSGKLLNESAAWCALRIRPAKWGQRYRITNLRNGRSMIVMHMDYGPGEHAYREHGAITDVTPYVFVKLGGNKRDGRMRVKVERIK